MKTNSFALLLALGALAPTAGAQVSSARPMTPFTPGAAASSGGFLGGDPCATIDDGTTENALGLTIGGWLCWMHYVDCLGSVDEVLTAYGTLSLPGGITNGRPARIVIWRDDSADQDPTTNLTHLQTFNTTTTNVDTDILNAYPMPMSLLPIAGWIGGAVQHSAGQFPAPMDTTNGANPRAWAFGHAVAGGGGSIDLMNIQNNNVPPQDTTTLGFPTVWLLRADGNSGPVTPGTAYCFCDAGSSWPAGVCGNPGAPGNGCANGVNPAGANLSASGTTNPDTVDFTATGVQPNQACLFFQGTNSIAGGDGIIFGDGLRCAGMNVIRLQVVTPNASGVASTSVSVGTEGGVGPGSGPRRYQAWYRNPSNSPCGNSFNLSNGYEIVW